MRSPAHHTSLTSCCHPLPPFFLLGHLLNSIFKSIVLTLELNKEQMKIRNRWGIFYCLYASSCASHLSLTFSFYFSFMVGRSVNSKEKSWWVLLLASKSIYPAALLVLSIRYSFSNANHLVPQEDNLSRHYSMSPV